MTEPTEPIYDKEAEKAVIGAVLVNNDAYQDAADAQLEAHDFYRPANRLIWQAIVKLCESGKKVVLLTVRQALDASGDLDKAGGPAYVASLTDGVPGSTNVGDQARIVRGCALRERLRQLSAVGSASVVQLRELVDALRDLDGAAAGGPVFTAVDPTWPDGEIELPLGILTRQRGQHHADAILPAGEVGVLAGAGGGGKSRLAMQIAVAGAGAVNGTVRPLLGEDTELRVGAGPALLVTWEDARPWLAWRARQIARLLDRAADAAEERPAGQTTRHRDAAADATRLAAVVLDGPLFGLRPGAGPGAIPERLTAWRPVWDKAAAIEARLIVIDPAALAFAVEGYGAVGVGLFYTAIRTELASLPEPAAALIVAHVTRDDRKEKRTDARPMGSVAWEDRARCVLTLTAADDGRAELRLSKANYARRGMLATLGSSNDSQSRPMAFEAVNEGGGDGETGEDATSGFQPGVGL